MDAIFEPFLRAVIAIIAVILFTRLNGLRSFSRMSSFDFALTIAFGSILGATISDIGKSFVPGIAALASVFVVQWIIARLRVLGTEAKRLVDNEPLLLVDGARMLTANMAAARITADEVRAKLRESGLRSFDQVAAVVLETTGNVSVIPKGPDGAGAEEVLEGVRRSI